MYPRVPCLRCRMEWEQLLEQHRTLQDSFDQLQAEAKFEADQARQQLQDRQQEIAELQARLTVSELMNSPFAILQIYTVVSELSFIYVFCCRIWTVLCRLSKSTQAPWCPSWKKTKRVHQSKCVQSVLLFKRFSTLKMTVWPCCVSSEKLLKPWSRIHSLENKSQTWHNNLNNRSVLRTECMSEKRRYYYDSKPSSASSPGCPIFVLKASKMSDLEQNSLSANETIKSLEQKIEQDKVSLSDSSSLISYSNQCNYFATVLNTPSTPHCVLWQDVVVDLINQTRDLRSELSQRDQTMSNLSGDIRDMTVRYSSIYSPFFLFYLK